MCIFEVENVCISLLWVNSCTNIMMQEMKNLNNFAGMFAVNAAFQSSPVFRLTHTMKVYTYTFY